MATLHGPNEDGGNLICVKGAVERLLERCTTMLQADGAETKLDQEAVHRHTEEMAAQGLRVLAFARRHIRSEGQQLAHGDVASGLTLLGLQGMIDPPRAEVVAAVHKCQTAGISVKMITGDHVLTAKAVAGADRPQRRRGIKNGIGRRLRPGPRPVVGYRAKRRGGTCCGVCPRGA
jgi:magnesium-transporting ATPase (P-type)